MSNVIYDLTQTDLIESVGVRRVGDVNSFGCSFTDVEHVKVDKTLTQHELRS